MLEHNKNLSSIIGTIQDEGPSSGETDRQRDVKDTTTPFDVEALISGRSAPRRPSWRLFFYILIATLVLAATLIFVAGGSDRQMADDSHATEQPVQPPYLLAENSIPDTGRRMAPAGTDEPTMSVTVGGQSDNFSNGDIHERQSLILQQLQELTAAIADIKASNNQHWIENQGELIKMQKEFYREFDKVAAVVAGLQQQPVAQSESPAGIAEDPVELEVALPQSGKVPVTGEWMVNVVSSEHLEPVEKLMSKLHERKIPAEIQEVMIGGKLRYRLRIPGFTSREEAREYARLLDGDLGLKDPWISER
ncbi:MAG: SPOR domain-containing protein [Gammaproteobacteria bacterium]